ncbi:MAG: T9SS type A sorting domain-containing protein [Ignavibacteriae bacterium]|nr:T9SS type A sorting domain-containing protein [Ignavibacteriota bacterium]
MADDSGHILKTTTGGISFINKTGNEIPDKYSLSQNYPNPFNPTTNIKYQITDNKFVTLKVYDILGKEIATLVNEKLNAGEYVSEFNGSGLPSGVYFYRLSVEDPLRQMVDFSETKKMLMIK